MSLSKVNLFKIIFKNNKVEEIKDYMYVGMHLTAGGAMKRELGWNLEISWSSDNRLRNV